MPSKHVARLRKHFHWHRNRIGVQIRYHHDPEGTAWAEAYTWESRTDTRVHGAVWLCEPISDTPSYFTGLHELGHLADMVTSRGTLRLRNRRPLLEREAWAWEWALKHACVKPNKATWRDMLASLKSYHHAYRCDLRIKQNENFDRLLERARKEIEWPNG